MEEAYNKYIEAFNNLDIDEKREHLLLLLKEIFQEEYEVNSKFGINSDIYTSDGYESEDDYLKVMFNYLVNLKILSKDNLNYLFRKDGQMKELVSVKKGTVLEIKVPNILKEDYFLPDEFINTLVFKVKVNDKNIILTGDRNKYSDVFVGDEVSINKYKVKGSYGEYLDNIKKIIDMTYLDKNKAFKEKEFEKYIISETDYKNNPREIIEYELV